MARSAQAMAISLNVARRQLSPEDVADLCAKLRAEGKSQNQIASAVGITQGAVSKALARAGHSQEYPDRIVGADGKSYPARREAPANVVALRPGGCLLCFRPSN